MATYHEAGFYRAEIISSVIEESRGEKKTPQFEFQLKILEEKSKYGEWSSYMVEDRYPPVIYMSITDGTMGDKDSPGWVTRTLKFMGFDFKTFDPATLKGWNGQVECRHEMAQFGAKTGWMVEKWSIVLEGSQKTMQNNDIVQGQMRNKYGKMFTGSTPKTAPAIKAPNKPNGTMDSPQSQDADIPF